MKGVLRLICDECDGEIYPQLVAVHNDPQQNFQMIWICKGCAQEFPDPSEALAQYRLTITARRPRKAVR